MQNGYIRLYRCIIDKGWSRKPEYVAVWVYILMRGNYTDQEVMLDGKIIALKPGQFVTSRKQMSINTGVNESKIQRILSLFENEQQIEQQTASKYRIISIVNWHKYQAREQQNEQQMNSKRTADEQQMNTDKEVKKVIKKEVKENHSTFALPHWVPCQAWQDYSDMREAKDKRSWTVAAKKLSISSLEKIVADGTSAEAVLNQSTEKGWKGLFALKENNNGNGTGKGTKASGGKTCVIGAVPTGADHWGESVIPDY